MSSAAHASLNCPCAANVIAAVTDAIDLPTDVNTTATAVALDIRILKPVSIVAATSATIFPSDANSTILLDIFSNEGSNLSTILIVIPRVAADNRVKLSFTSSADLAILAVITIPRRSASSLIAFIPSPPSFNSGINSFPARPNICIEADVFSAPSSIRAKRSAISVKTIFESLSTPSAVCVVMPKRSKAREASPVPSRAIDMLRAS